MASDLTETLHRIADKSHFLTQRYEVVAQERAQALRRVAELEQTIARKDKELEQLRMQVEYLTVSSTLAPNRDQLDQTRAMISQMMRDIDKCIADLNE